MTGPRRIAGLVVVFAAILAVLPAPAEQAPVFDWEAGLETAAAFSDSGSGSVFGSRDRLTLSLRVTRGLWGGTLSAGIAGGLAYTPQEAGSGEPVSEALRVYPGPAGIAWESLPPWSVSPWFRASLGRIEAREPTNLLFYDPGALHPAQLMDGLEFEFRLRRFYAAAQTGYLGFLDRRLNRVLLSAADRAEYEDPSVYAAPRRLLSLVRLEAESPAFRQDAGIFGIWQKDFRPAPEGFDSWYFGLAVSGPVSGRVRHESCAVLSLSRPAAGGTGAGILAHVRAGYDLTGTPFTEAWFSALWASGGSGGLEAFPELAGPPVSLLYAEPASDVVRLELGIRAEPAVPPGGARLDAGLAARLILVPSGVLQGAYSFAPSGAYAGTELELSLGYQPLPGLRFSSRAGALLTPEGPLPGLRISAEVQL